MKPPVEAPTSTQSRPSTSISNASSAFRELLSSARDERRRPLDAELDVLVDQLAGLLVARDEAGQHERLRLAPGLREAFLDQEHVEPLADGFNGSTAELVAQEMNICRLGLWC